MADYRLCDLCGGKAFYDSNLNYDFGPRLEDAEELRVMPFRDAGEPQYADEGLNKGHGLILDYLGDWAVLCHNCAKTHRTAIVPKDAADG